MPVVETWDLPEAPLDRVVGFSNAAAGALVARHLHAQGRRRIGFIGGDGRRDTRGADRQRGFAAALQALGLATERRVAGQAPPLSMREGAQALNRLLDRWPDTDAVMCVSDLSAFGALTAAQRRGLAVPEDLALAGFGAYDLAEHALPGLTTVDAQARRIGDEAAGLILAALEDPGASTDPGRVVLPLRLLARDSTAAG